MKQLIMDNWQMLTLYGVTVLILIVAVLRVPKKWLLWACTEAETALGGGTGQLKLLYVYKLYIGQFPVVGKLIPFALFSKFVDWVLPVMRKMLENKKIAEIVEKRDAI